MILSKEVWQNYLIDMAKPPSALHYRGNLTLLEKPKIAIVGTRKPTQYTRLFTRQLSSMLSNAGICIVSGGAMGVDALAHTGATPQNTIAVFVISNNKLNSTRIKLTG
jgi:DNA processing protein